MVVMTAIQNPLIIRENSNRFGHTDLNAQSSYNHFHKILKLVVLLNFPFTTSEMKHNY